MTRLCQVPQAPTIFTPFVTMENFDELPMPPPVCTPCSFEHSSSYIFSRRQGWRRDRPQPHRRDLINKVGRVLRKIVTCTADNQRKAASLASNHGGDDGFLATISHAQAYGSMGRALLGVSPAATKDLT